MATKKHRAKRLGHGGYLYRGIRIQRYDNEGFLRDARYIWEAVDHTGCGFAHSGALSVTKALIDEDIEEGRIEER